MCKGDNKMDFQPMFDLGKCVATPSVHRLLQPYELNELLKKHVFGDFGDICDADKRFNYNAIRQQRIVYSRYYVRNHEYYVITSIKDGKTRIMLAEEYE
jgi:hypothetical protein